MPELYMILARKIINIPEFYGFGPKMPEFYIITARNIFFPNVGGGHVPSLPPISYAYGEVVCLHAEPRVSSLTTSVDSYI